jgi:hypothetical protein
LLGAIAAASACLDFDDAYDECQKHPTCSTDGGSGGGAGGSGGSGGGGEGGSGGGSGGAGGGSGGGAGGSGGGSGGSGGGAGGGAGGGSGGGAGGSGGGSGGGGGTVDAGFCGGNWCLASSGNSGVFEMTDGMFASAPDRAWATSYGAKLIFWNGSGWGAFNLAGSDPIFGVWGYPPNNVITVGQNGESFAIAGSASAPVAGIGFRTMRAVHGLEDGGSIFAAGEYAKIFRLAGSNWVMAHDGGADVLATPTLRGLWMLAANDGFASGAAGTLLRYNGATWTAVTGLPGITNQNLNRIWASGVDDVWVVGQFGVVLHYDGATWSRRDYTGVVNSLWGVWGTGTGEVYVAGSFGTLAHWQGDGGWKSIPTGVTSEALISLWGAGQFDLFTTPAFLPDGGNGPLHFRR